MRMALPHVRSRSGTRSVSHQPKALRSSGHRSRSMVSHLGRLAHDDPCIAREFSRAAVRQRRPAPTQASPPPQQPAVEPQETSAVYGDWTLRCIRQGEGSPVRRLCEVAQPEAAGAGAAFCPTGARSAGDHARLADRCHPAAQYRPAVHRPNRVRGGSAAARGARLATLPSERLYRRVRTVSGGVVETADRRGNGSPDLPECCGTRDHAAVSASRIAASDRRARQAGVISPARLAAVSTFGRNGDLHRQGNRARVRGSYRAAHGFLLGGLDHPEQLQDMGVLAAHGLQCLFGLDRLPLTAEQFGRMAMATMFPGSEASVMAAARSVRGWPKSARRNRKCVSLKLLKPPSGYRRDL